MYTVIQHASDTEYTQNTVELWLNSTPKASYPPKKQTNKKTTTTNKQTNRDETLDKTRRGVHVHEYVRKRVEKPILRDGLS